MQPDRPILVVEDDQGIRETVVDLLTWEGYFTATAANGLDALQQLESLKPALVLLDMRMPILDGWEFARRLKKRGVELPIIVMTAAQDAQRWAQEIDAQGYIAKPFDIDDLLRAVEQQLQQG